MFMGLFKILVQFGKLFVLMMDFIPLVFDPPTNERYYVCGNIWH